MDAQCTTDYSLFSCYLGNRPVTERIAKIAESMRIHGFIKAYCIVVNSKMEILDGQHRFEAAKLLEIPVYFKIDDSISLPQVQAAGGLSRAWTRMDYIHSYASIGNPHYLRMQECILKSKFKDVCCIGMLARVTTRNVTIWQDLLIKGVLEFSPQNVSAYWAIHLKVEFITDKIPEYQESANAVHGIIAFVTNPKYDQSKMKDKITYLSNRFVKRFSVREYIDLLYEIYNFKTTAAHKLEPVALFGRERK